MTVALPGGEGVPAGPAYDRWAASYDGVQNATRDLDAAALRATALPLEGATVVELGAGTGKNTAFLAAHARAVTALDLSKGMLEIARRQVRSDRVRFVEHDIRQSWPVESESADLVVGNLVLEHLCDIGPVFAEADRVLRPGGLLYLSELHPYRQYAGSRARFETAGGTVLVEAYLHSLADYVNGALAQGFALVSLGEWHDPGHAVGPPRLLTLLCRRRGDSPA